MNSSFNSRIAGVCRRQRRGKAQRRHPLHRRPGNTRRQLLRFHRSHYTKHRQTSGQRGAFYSGLFAYRLLSCQSSFAHRTASANGHSAETSYRIKSGHPEGHFYGASGACNTGKWIGHKGNFFKGGIRVPAIISYPARLPKGEVRNQIITAMDWYPTVLELCGVKPKVTALKLDGHNLLPMIESTDVKSGCNGVLHFQWGEKWAVREGEWKLIGTDGKLKMTLHRLTDAKPETLN